MPAEDHLETTDDLPPGINPELQSDVFATTVGVLTPRDVGIVETFFTEVVKFCNRWLATHGQTSTPLVFLLSNRPDLDPLLEKFVAVGSWTPHGDPPRLGPLVLSSANMRVVYEKVVSGQTLPELLQHIAALGLDARPAAVFIPAVRGLTFYRQGLGTRGIETGALNLTLEQRENVVQLLAAFHDEYTRYPDGVGNCWISAGDRLVQSNAERSIQQSLYIYLSRVIYQTSYITREHQLPNGRADIWIYGTVLGEDPGAHCLIELKVLRSRSSTWAIRRRPNGTPYPDRPAAFNRDYVQRGARQAASYKAAGGAARAILCCFDARVSNDEIETLPAYATDLNVEYFRYYMESAHNP